LTDDGAVKRATTLLVCLLGVATTALPAEPTVTPADDELAEVLVTAPQPRYVAPTNRDRIGRVWVPVFLNDKGPFRLVLDSGATRSAVTAQVARTLQISLDQAPRVLLRGVTGAAIVPTIKVDSLSVGDLWIGPAILPIVADAFGGAEGLLGTDGMQEKRIFIDFRNDFINVSTSRNRRAPSDFQTIPFLKNNLQLLIVNATVGTTQVRAIIDTGAQATIGNPALQVAMRRTIARGAGNTDQITGATGEVQSGIGANVSIIQLGDITIRDAHVTFGDMHIFDHWNLGDEPALLIGMDVLGLLDTLVIDYRRRELQIKSWRNP
jgi:predicted aspartyl protease